MSQPSKRSLLPPIVCWSESNLLTASRPMFLLIVQPKVNNSLPCCCLVMVMKIENVSYINFKIIFHFNILFYNVFIVLQIYTVLSDLKTLKYYLHRLQQLCIDSVFTMMIRSQENETSSEVIRPVNQNQTKYSAIVFSLSFVLVIVASWLLLFESVVFKLISRKSTSLGTRILI